MSSRREGGVPPKGICQPERSQWKGAHARRGRLGDGRARTWEPTEWKAGGWAGSQEHLVHFRRVPPPPALVGWWESSHNHVGHLAAGPERHPRERRDQTSKHSSAAKEQDLEADVTTDPGGRYFF